MSLENFAARLKSLREKRRWTQQELAGRLGCMPGHISMLEAGKRTPSFDLIHRLAKALGVKPGALLD